MIPIDGSPPKKAAESRRKRLRKAVGKADSKTDGSSLVLTAKLHMSAAIQLLR